MRNNGLIFLMYHELEANGRPLCHAEQGYVRYVVREPDFRAQMNWLQSAGFRGLSVANVLEKRDVDGIVITFDDGCASDLAIAAPILREMNFNATFYITVGFLGRPGYLVPSQVRDLSDAGFEVGCHSMTHPYLSDLNEAQLHTEIAEAKGCLENIIGRAVHQFSCPGGRWSLKVAEHARQAGYRSVATSRIGANHPQADAFRLARVAVMRDIPLHDFQHLSRGHAFWQRRFLKSLQRTSRQLLGNTLYDRLRSFILEP